MAVVFLSLFRGFLACCTLWTAQLPGPRCSEIILNHIRVVISSCDIQAITFGKFLSEVLLCEHCSLVFLVDKRYWREDLVDIVEIVTMRYDRDTKKLSIVTFYKRIYSLIVMYGERLNDLYKKRAINRLKWYFDSSHKWKIILRICKQLLLKWKHLFGEEMQKLSQYFISITMTEIEKNYV